MPGDLPPLYNAHSKNMADCGLSLLPLWSDVQNKVCSDYLNTVGLRIAVPDGPASFAMLSSLEQHLLLKVSICCFATLAAEQSRLLTARPYIATGHLACLALLLTGIVILLAGVVTAPQPRYAQLCLLLKGLSVKLKSISV